MHKPKVCVLRTAGTNCDSETAYAFTKAGAQAELVHINRLAEKKDNLDNYDILAIPGGFTYADDIAAGKLLANEFRFRIPNQIKKFVWEGKLIIGICNGFQVLVKSGLLPGNIDLRQEASLIINDSGKFEDRWVYLGCAEKQSAQVKCAWTRGLPELIYLPVAHGEGKFVCGEKSLLDKLNKSGQVVLRYCGPDGKSKGYPYNPNGSQDDIAGICDETGRILGLMPHPERHIEAGQNPLWACGRKKESDGFMIFKNGVDYARKNL